MVWSGNAQLFFGADSVDDALAVRFAVATAGRYDLSVVYTRAADYGVITLALDGQTIGASFDGYRPNVVIAPAVDYGSVQLGAGEHTLMWTVTGRNAASSGFLAGIDVVRLEQQE